MLDLDAARPVRQVLAGLDGGQDPAEWWSKRREELKAVIEGYIGRPPLEPFVPRPRMVEERRAGAYRHLVIAYDVEPGDEVRAHLLIPDRPRRLQGAAVLCLHGTAVEAKDTQVGKGAKRNRGFDRARPARFHHAVARPRAPASGSCRDTSLRHGPLRTASDWSAVGKAIWDGRRAVDVLMT